MTTFDTFPALTFDQFVTNFLNILQTSSPAINDSSVGSIPLAWAEATAGNDLALQSLAYHVYNMARLTTSTGTDVDTFVGDFGLTRAPASEATGFVTLTRNLTGSVLMIPAGAIVQTTIGGIQFQLIADPSNPSWNVGDNAYVFGIGIGSIAPTIQAIVAGSAGNVLVGTINQIVSGISGVNSVSNAAPTAGGSDEESDQALKTRFQLYIEGLAKATVSAVEAAIEGVQAGLTFQLMELEHFDGTPFIGGFTIVVDDGSGHIPGGTITAIIAAVNAVRAAGISFEVHAPTNITTNVSVSVTPASPFSSGAVAAAVTTSITQYIQKLGVGETVSFVGVANAIQNTQITNQNCVFAYTDLLINTVAGDLVIAWTQIAEVGTIAVSA